MGCCEHGNELSGSVKCEFLDELVKKVCAPWICSHFCIETYLLLLSCLWDVGTKTAKICPRAFPCLGCPSVQL